VNSPSVVHGTAESETRTSVLPAETAASRPDSQATVTGALILDGNTRSALAATRSLGKKGVPVVVGGETSRTLAGASRYCNESFTYPSPARDLNGFLATVKRESSRRGIGMILIPRCELLRVTSI
jgi:alkanesulfonate monooxygenase SsuD/methylene tetrahydromethanopterin reductase-like flavin-dependent oxidoreductase (luciferase family)